jgi:hypothetical protein
LNAPFSQTQKSRVDGFPWSAKKSKNALFPKRKSDSLDPVIPLTHLICALVTENRPLRRSVNVSNFDFLFFLSFCVSTLVRFSELNWNDEMREGWRQKSNQITINP